MTQPFIALLRKELRHGSGWCLLGFLITAAAMLFAMKLQLEYIDRFGPANETPTYSSVAVFLALAVGLMMGIAQMVPENGGDKWGFMMHRPASRSTLFFAKATAGVILYSIAIVAPLSGAFIWLAIPGHLPRPFDWHLVLPQVADLLTGMAYYFGGLLLATRVQHGRFGGIFTRLVRLSGIGVPVVTMVGVLVVPDFWQALLCGALGIVITGTAAWAAFVTGGRFEAQPAITRTATSLTFGTGLAVAALIAAVTIGAFLPQTEFTRSISHTVASNGEIVEVVRDSNVTTEVNDLAGRPVPEYQDPESRKNLSEGVVTAAAPLYPEVKFPSDRSYRATTQLFVEIRPTDTPAGGPVSWYYIYREKLIAGYDNRSARLIGWFGPDGFSAGQARPERRFQNDPVQPDRFKYYGRSIIEFPEAVYRIDLNQKLIRKIFTPLPGESVVGADSQGGNATLTTLFGTRAAFDLIATTQRIVIQGLDGQPQLVTPRDPAAEGVPNVEASRALRAPEQPTFIWYDSPYGRKPQLVIKFAAGMAQARYTVPGVGPLATAEPGLVVVSTVAPVTVPIAIRLVTHLTKAPDFFAPASPQMMIAIWTLSTLASLVSFFLAYRRGSTYAFKRTRLWLWSALGFLLGPVAFVLMLLLFEWPAREKCPSCGRRRIVTRERCEHCGGPFGVPAADGTEIFAL